MQSTLQSRTLVRAGVALAAARGSLEDTRAFVDAMVRRGAWWQEDRDFGKNIGEFGNHYAIERYVTKADPGMVDPSVVAASSQFLDWARAETIIARLPAARNVGFQTGVVVATAGTVAAWVGEAAAKPVVEAAFANTSLPPRKVAVITTLSRDLTIASAVDVEERLGADLKAGVVETLDAAFASADAAIAGVKPAGIFHGAPTIASTGSTAAQMVADLNAMVAALSTAGVSLRSACWIMRPEAATAYALAFPAVELGVNGGMLAGLPAIVSSGMPEHTVGLLASEYVVVAGGDIVALRVSEEANVDMAGGNAPTFSMWQRNCVALIAEVWGNWSLAGGPRDSSGDPLGAVLLTGVSYG
jgi:hypothetical protein